LTEEFAPKILYVKVLLNVAADSLSRLSINTENAEEISIAVIEPNLDEIPIASPVLQQHQAKDKALQRNKNWLPDVLDLMIY
jgi:hypothetical protein